MKRVDERGSVTVAARLVLAAVLWVLGGCGPELSGSCSICGTELTDVQCNANAVAAGCARGESYFVDSCSPAGPMGCRYYGCTTVVPSCDPPASGPLVERDGG